MRQKCYDAATSLHNMYLISIVYESLVYRVSFYNENPACFESISIDIDGYKNEQDILDLLVLLSVINHNSS